MIEFWCCRNLGEKKVVIILPDEFIISFQLVMYPYVYFLSCFIEQMSGLKKLFLLAILDIPNVVFLL